MRFLMEAISSAVRFASKVRELPPPTTCVLDASTNVTTAASARTTMSRNVRPGPGIAKFQFVSRSSLTSVRVRHVTRSRASGARSNDPVGAGVCGGA
jgi:hypothetical protein